MRNPDISLLRCPECRARLAFLGIEQAGGLEDGVLRCVGCAIAWPVEHGLPILFREARVSGNDRLMRLLYDGFAPFHDAAVRHVLPLMQSGSERSLRDGYMRRIDLASLESPPSGRPVRILEVGIGAGANIDLVLRDVPAGVPFELWGLDLSRGMIDRCLERLRGMEGHRAMLLMADAHALPFGDGTFDRVFHVGGIGGFGDPGRALAEMARVAVPGTPIVVVDEQLDRDRRNLLFHRAMFRALTFYDPDPHCPRELLPAGAGDVIEEQLSRFYYCLAFRMPSIT